MHITSLYRYPVKGLSPEPVARLDLAPGAFVPGDRIYAVENGASGFNSEAPVHIPKVAFLCLMKNARLAALRTAYDHETGVLTLAAPDGERIAANLGTAEGRAAVEEFLTGFMGEERRGDLRVLAAPGHSFADTGRTLVSFINLASVAALGTMAGAELDPLRFRANAYLTGLEPWAELDFLDREARLGAVRLRFVKLTKRCAATSVDPATGIRDLDLPATLLANLGHMNCGIYAEVIEGGTIRPGDVLDLA